MRRKSSRRNAVWPYLGVLACLFALSVTAPCAWQRVARQTPFDGEPARPRIARSNAPSEHPTPARSHASVAIDVSPARMDAVRQPPVEPVNRETAAAAADSNSQPPSVGPLLAAPEQPKLAPPQNAPTASELAVKTSDATENDRAASDRDAPVQEAPAAPEAPRNEPADELAADVPPVPAQENVSRPTALIHRFEELAADRRTGHWANECLEAIAAVWPTPPQPTSARDPDVLKLRRLAAREMSAGGNPQLATMAERARWALVRWLDIRDAVAELDAAPTAKTPDDATKQVAASLSAIDKLSLKGIAGGEWRNFLLVDRLRLLTSEVASPEARCAAARRVLDRLDSPRLTSGQRRFIAQEPVASLRAALAGWAAEPVAPARLLADVERYERSGLPSDATSVANDLRGLKWSDAGGAARVSEQLDTHYRNANLRVTASVALMNRLVPQRRPTEAPVYDTVVDVPVYGNSLTSTRLKVLLVPDPQRIRIGLEVDGKVDSNTVATSGPATFYNQGRSTFVVQKLFVLGPYGLTVFPAKANADASGTYLVSMDTNFDGVPLFGGIVRNIARSKHDEQSGQARVEVEYKLSERARKELDGEIGPRLSRLVDKVENKQLALVNRLGLELVPLEMATTKETIVARARLGNPRQLGAHTPRPRVPAGSWFSFEIEQSALNNLFERLDLDGRTFELSELFRWLAKKLDRPQQANLDELPEGVRVTFAERDAVRVRVADERVELTLSFAELVHERRRFTNFSVRTTFQPEVRSRQAVLVRDSGISLDGRHLNTRAKVPLYTIFSKVFAHRDEVPLLDEKITQDLRLSDLALTQFTLDDGWISLAYGTSRVATQRARPASTSGSLPVRSR